MNPTVRPGASSLPYPSPVTEAEGLLAKIRGGLVVSCQALPGMPFDGPIFLAEMARAAQLGGAVAIRANGPENIRAIRRAVSLPVIGLVKLHLPGTSVYITPTREAALAAAEAGSAMVAVDATRRPRPPGEDLPRLVEALHRLGVPVLGDIATVEDGAFAEACGVDAVATTLCGHTEDPPQPPGQLLEALTRRLKVPVLMEGGVWSPEEARRSLDHGAWAVVVGRAITMPHAITQRFVAALAGVAPKASAAAGRIPGTEHPPVGTTDGRGP